MDKYFERIEMSLVAAGFKKDEVASEDFSAVYTIRSMFTSLVFLVKVIEDEVVDSIKVKEIVDSGREWCFLNLKATWFVKESGLNLILLHKDKIKPDDIKSQTDKTGFHGSICQSVTALNVTNDILMQEKTWIVLGKAKKALSNLKENAYQNV